MKNKGADFAWIGGTTNSTAVILKDAKKLGLKTKFFSNIWGADETTPKLAGGRRGRRPRDGRVHACTGRRSPA